MLVTAGNDVGHGPGWGQDGVDEPCTSHYLDSRRKRTKPASIHVLFLKKAINRKPWR